MLKPIALIDASYLFNLARTSIMRLDTCGGNLVKGRRDLLVATPSHQDAKPPSSTLCVFGSLLSAWNEGGPW